MMVPLLAQALPAFNRQTGQNCLACHAGGQFPELTPYGRMFKMTGYTIGQRALPLSMMAVVSSASVRDTSKSDDPAGDFQKNGVPLFATASLFIAGKITDNLGLFSQLTYDNYASQDAQGNFHGHTNVDNIDLRYADRFIDAGHDLIVGMSLNNNPSVTDPWNTAPAWMQYVPVPSPTSYRFIDGNAPFPALGAGANLAGLNVYAFWNKTIYGELGTYRTANRAFSLLSAGINDQDTTKLNDTNNPYWRFALSHEWGPHNLMVGTTGMIAHVYDSGSSTSDPNNLGRFKNTGIDAQYQYLLDPHTVTVQAAYMRQKQDYSANVVNWSARLPGRQSSAIRGRQRQPGRTDQFLRYDQRVPRQGDLYLPGEVWRQLLVFQSFWEHEHAQPDFRLRPDNRPDHQRSGRIAGCDGRIHPRRRKPFRQSDHPRLHVRSFLDAGAIRPSRSAVHGLQQVQRCN